MSKPVNELIRIVTKQPLWRIGVAAAALVLVGYFLLGRTTHRSNGTTFVVRRGNLPINVLVGGSAEALESQEIRSQIKGYQGTKILTIVEEGYLVTEEDIRTNKVLVELDSSDLKQKIVTEEIQFQATLSSLIEAQQAYAIQTNQNLSDLKAAEQKARFALMDFEKFLSKTNTQEIIDQLGLHVEPFTNEVNEAELDLAAAPLQRPSPNNSGFPPASAQVIDGSVLPMNGPGGAAMRGPMSSGDLGAPPERGGQSPPSDGRISPDMIAKARAEAARLAARDIDSNRARGSRQGQGAIDDPDRPQRASRSPRGIQPPADASHGAPAGDPMGALAARSLPSDMSPMNLPPSSSIPPIAGTAQQVLTNALLAKSLKSAGPSTTLVSNTPPHLGTNVDSLFAPDIDFTKYAKSDMLGDGAAKQQLRKLEDDKLLAEQTLSLSKVHLAGTERLFTNKFVGKDTLDSEKLTVQRNDVQVASTKTSLDLFIKYELTRQAEDFLSKYDESLRSLERARKEAVSKLAQARARLKAAEGRYRIECDQRQELSEQFSNCVIRAKRPGLVVYGGSDERRFFGGEDQIREGATVRERQPIITIPDMTRMAIKVKIHESHIKKVRKGQKARIKVDAFPDEQLSGEVIKVGVLPDSGNRWMNPDMKVYLCSVAVEGMREWLKPGLSAQVEILVKELTNVVHVPLQAVVPMNGKQVCFIPNGGQPEQRVVEVGEYSDEFIEIKKGLKEGEKVLLRAPEGTETDQGANGDGSEDEATQAAPNKGGAGTAPAVKLAPSRPNRDAGPGPGTAGRGGSASPPRRPGGP